MATRYWVGGAGTWDASSTTHWAASSGGAGGQSVPGSGDDVIFDEHGNESGDGNYTVTVTATANCANLTVGNPGAGVITLAGTSYINVYGNLYYASGVSVTHTGSLYMNATSGTKTITTNGNVIQHGTFWLNGGATFQLADHFTTAKSFRRINGTFDANSKNFSFVGTTASYLLGALTFYNLTIAPASSTMLIFNINDNITVSNTLTLTPYTGKRMVIKGWATGFKIRITSATNVISANVDFMDIEGAGAGSWDLSALNAGNMGNTSGITFPTAVDRYWVATSGGNWSATSSWSDSDGGASGASVPLAHDTAHFTSGSITSSGKTITCDVNVCPGTDLSALANSPTFKHDLGSTYYICGTLDLRGIGTYTCSSYVYLVGRGTHNYNTGGKTQYNPGIDCGAGSYTLQSDLTVTYNFYLYTGNFDFNDYNATIGGYVQGSSNALPRTLRLGNGTIILCNTTLTANVTAWYMACAFLTLYGEGSTIKISNSTAYKVTFAGYGLTYNNIWFTGTGNYEINITGGNTFNDFKIDTMPKTLKFTAGTTNTVATWTITDNDTAQIAIDASSNCGTNLYGNSTVTWSHTVGAGSNRFLVVSVSGYYGMVNSVTFNGVALTKLNQSGNNYYSQIWYLANPDSGAHDIVITTDGGFGCYGSAGAISFTGVDQVNPIDASATATGTSSSPSVSITTTTKNTMLVDSIKGDNCAAAIYPGASQTSFYVQKTANTNSGGGSTKPVAATGAATMSWTLPLSCNWFLCVVALRGAGKLTIGSITSATHTLAKSGGGTITSPYCSISYSIASPAATWHAGHYSINGGNNTNWLFGDAQTKTCSTETVTHTDSKTTARTAAKTLTEIVAHTDIFSKLWTLAERVLTETAGFFDYLLKGAGDHLQAAKVIFQENFEGGKLQGNFDRVLASETGTVSIDTTSKVSGKNSLKIETTGEGQGARLIKNFGATYSTIYLQFKITIPADFDFNGTSYFSILDIFDIDEMEELLYLVIEDWGNLRLILGGVIGWLDTGVSLVRGNTYKIELGVIFHPTEGVLAIWVDNDVSNAPTAMATGLDTGSIPAGAFLTAEIYTDGAHTPYYVDDYFVSNVFIGRFSAGFSQTLTETITFTATLLKSAARILTETATFTASLVKSGVKTLAETIAHSDSLEALRAIFKVFTEALTHTDTVTRGETRTMGETVTHTDNVNRTATRNLLETVTFTDAITYGTKKIKDLLETVTHTPTIIRTAVRTLTETVSHTAALTWWRHTTKTLTETITHTVTTLRGVSRLISEEVAHYATLSKKPVRTATETATHTDDLTKLRTAYKVLADTVTLTSALVKATTKVLTETISHSDTWRAWRNGIRAGIWNIRAKVVTTWTHTAKIATTWTHKAKITTPWTKKPKP